jgi:hypothetical protein
MTMRSLGTINPEGNGMFGGQQGPRGQPGGGYQTSSQPPSYTPASNVHDMTMHTLGTINHEGNGMFSGQQGPRGQAGQNGMITDAHFGQAYINHTDVMQMVQMVSVPGCECMCVCIFALCMYVCVFLRLSKVLETRTHRQPFTYLCVC